MSGSSGLSCCEPVSKLWDTFLKGPFMLGRMNRPLRTPAGEVMEEATLLTPPLGPECVLGCCGGVGGLSAPNPLGSGCCCCCCCCWFCCCCCWPDVPLAPREAYTSRPSLAIASSCSCCCGCVDVSPGGVGELELRKIAPPTRCFSSSRQVRRRRRVSISFLSCSALTRSALSCSSWYFRSMSSDSISKMATSLPPYMLPSFSLSRLPPLALSPSTPRPPRSPWW
mmetsp:Transcript_8232/g.20400  ORF Transcript_8232/g.20400 Transcript_8232/m.20400 type:complete len:225 (-) Transcript_8232:1707-2381(-)